MTQARVCRRAERGPMKNCSSLARRESIRDDFASRCRQMFSDPGWVRGKSDQTRSFWLAIKLHWRSSTAIRNCLLVAWPSENWNKPDMSTSAILAIPSKDRYSTRMRHVWTSDKVFGRLRGCGCRTFRSCRLCRILKRGSAPHPKVYQEIIRYEIEGSKSCFHANEEKRFRPSCTHVLEAEMRRILFILSNVNRCKLPHEFSTFPLRNHWFISGDQEFLSLRSNRFIKVSSGESLTWYF